MSNKLWIILIVFTLSIASVYAHGEGEDDGDQPPQPVSEITLDSPNSESVPSQTNESSDLSIFDLTQSELTLLIAGSIFSVAFGGILWSVVGRQMSILLILSTILTAYTAFIHFEAGLAGDYLLLANAAGYLFLSLVRAPVNIQNSTYNKALTLVFIVYTAITFVGYFLLHSHVEVVGLSSKAAEAILITILLRQLFSSREAKATARRTAISPTINYFTQS